MTLALSCIQTPALLDALECIASKTRNEYREWLCANLLVSERETSAELGGIDWCVYVCRNPCHQWVGEWRSESTKSSRHARVRGFALLHRITQVLGDYHRVLIMQQTGRRCDCVGMCWENETRTRQVNAVYDETIRLMVDHKAVMSDT
jgi:hypothetical protein